MKIRDRLLRWMMRRLSAMMTQPLHIILVDVPLVSAGRVGDGSRNLWLLEFAWPDGQGPVEQITAPGPMEVM